MKLQVGDTVRVVFNQKLPGCDIGPNLKQGDTHEVFNVYTDKKGNDHIDIGLVLQCNYVSSYATGEILPGNVHWCHPNRFIKIT